MGPALAVHCAALTTIREATEADIDVIVGMAQRFVLTTSYGAHVPNDPDHLRRVTVQLMTIGTVFIAFRDDTPAGMLAAAIYPHYLTTRLTASETAWWVEENMRGARIAKDLLERFEAWALEKGAAVVELGSRHERLDRFYGRLGYQPVERVFQKELSR